jgi:tRNA G10  N-methylase Trm11
MKRSEDFVKQNCGKKHSNVKCRWKTLVKEEWSYPRSKKISSSTGRQKKSVHEVAKLFESERHKKCHFSTVYRELKRQGFKPFHVQKKPFKTALNIEDSFANLCTLFFLPSSR